MEDLALGTFLSGLHGLNLIPTITLAGDTVVIPILTNEETEPRVRKSFTGGLRALKWQSDATARTGDHCLFIDTVLCGDVSQIKLRMFKSKTNKGEAWFYVPFSRAFFLQFPPQSSARPTFDSV